jgi:AbrB family looped-hinge helix DNA binding protein
MTVILSRMPKLWRSGHIVIPKALRDKHDIHPGDEVEIFQRDDAIVIRKASTEPRPRAERSAR